MHSHSTACQSTLSDAVAPIDDVAGKENKGPPAAGILKPIQLTVFECRSAVVDSALGNAKEVPTFWRRPQLVPW